MMAAIAVAIGPEDEVVVLNDEEMLDLDDEDEHPLSVLDPEKAHDDAC